MTNHKSVFITGATGYIGGSALSLVIPELQKLGIQANVRALVRTPGKAENLRKWAAVRGIHNVQCVQGDFGNLNLLDEESLKADIVIHAGDADDLEAAKAITKGLSRRIESGKHPVFIHTSGSANIFEDVKGLTPGEKIYHDNRDDELNSIPDSNPHREVDIHVRDFHKAYEGKVDVIVIAPSTIWGIGTGPENVLSQQIPNLIRVALRHRQAYYVGNGIATWTEINILDLAALYALLLKKAIEEPNKHSGFYFASNEEFQWKEAVQAIQDGLVIGGFTTATEAKGLSSHESKNIFTGSYPWDMAVGSASRPRAIKGPAIGWNRMYSSKEKFLNDIVQEVAILARYDGK